MMERNALRNAQASASQAEFLIDQARKASPAVQTVARVSIAKGFVIQHFPLLFHSNITIFLRFRSIVSDVFFDNIFTDIAFHSTQYSPSHLRLALD